MHKKNIVIAVVTTVMLSSCSNITRGWDDNVNHYEQLTRMGNTHSISFDKSSNVVSGAKYLVANEPDASEYISGADFNESYNKLISYMGANGYEVVSNDRLGDIATVVAKVPKPMPDMVYMAVTMQLNTKYDEISFHVLYGGNEFKANQFFHNYKKTL